jgi:hypothetical protein
LFHDSKEKITPKAFPICQIKSEKKLISASAFSIKIWDTETYEEIKEIDISGGQIFSLCDLKNGWFATGRQTHIDIFSTNGNFVKSLQGHVDTVTRMFLHSSGYLISTSFDKTVRIWDPQNKFCVGTWKTDSRGITELEDGRIVCSNKNTIDFYDIKDDEEIFTSLIEVYENLNEKENLKEIYLRLIRFYQENSKYFAAEAFLSKIESPDEISLQLYIKNCEYTSNPKGKIEKQMELAKLFKKESRYSDALRIIFSIENYETNVSSLILLESIYETLDKVDDQYDIIFELGKVLYSEENYELAEKYLKKIKSMSVNEMELLSSVLKENNKIDEEAEVY